MSIKYPQQQFPANTIGSGDLSGNLATVDNTGALKVAGTFTGSSAAVGVIGSPAPTSADQVGFNVGGNLQSVSTTNPLPENLSQVGGAAIALGQTTKSASLPVTLASDQNNSLETGGNLATIVADLTNGTQQSKITDGTNIANVIAGDTGSNGQVVATGNKLMTGGLITWSGTSGTVAYGPIDTLGYLSYRLHCISVGTTVSSVSAQFSQVNTGNFVTSLGANVNTSTGSIVSSASAGAMLAGPISGRYLQILTNGTQTAGSTTFFVELSTMPFVPLSVFGTVAGQAAIGTNTTQNPLLAGVRSQNAEATAVTNGQIDYIAADLVGKIIVMPFANKENFVSGTATSTGTSDTSVIASAGGSLKNYITGYRAYNSGAAASLFTIKNGSGGATLDQIYVPAGGSAVVSYPTPIPTSAATAVYFASGTATTTAGITVNAYTGT